MTLIAVVNYGVGNLTSIANMFKRLSVNARVTSDAEVIRSASGLVLPGVGHFDACMENFHASGLLPAIQSCLEGGLPILGICVGAQMMTRGSQEGTRPGLGWVSADTVRFKVESWNLRVPHMGWSDVELVGQSPLWEDLPPEPRFYFAHSYHFLFDDNQAVTCQAHYGYGFACAFRRENLFGVQFHPEKSHRFGMKLLENFSRLSKC